MNIHDEHNFNNNHDNGIGGKTRVSWVLATKKVGKGGGGGGRIEMGSGIEGLPSKTGTRLLKCSATPLIFCRNITISTTIMEK